MLNDFPEVCHINMLSDGPVTQYKNKKMIYFILHNIPKLFPQFLNFTWNYSVAGHGKGAADGIGAALKRTADQLIAHGEDINTFEVFVEKLKKYILKKLKFL